MPTHRTPAGRSEQRRGRRRLRALCSASFVVGLALAACIASCRIRRLDAAQSDASSASASLSASISAPASVSHPPSASASTPLSASAPAPPASSAAIQEPEAPEGAAVVGIGGAGSDPSLSAIVLEAVRKSVKELAKQRNPLDAAVDGVIVLEDAPELNAGTGSSIRFDGNSVQMDAALMDSEGRLGVVASLASVKNPILVARAVADTPNPILVGAGAVGFARTKGYKPFDPKTPRARAQRELTLLSLGAALDAGAPEAGIIDAAVDANVSDAADAGTPREAGAAAFKGDPQPPGAVAIVMRTPDGVFVVAGSDGGRPAGLPGQVGATSVPGAALFAGPKGAVAATGPEDPLIRTMLARYVYDRMAQTRSPQQAALWGLSQLPDDIDAGLVAMNARTFHIEARGPMAWASWTSKGEKTAQPAKESKP